MERLKIPAADLATRNALREAVRSVEAGIPLTLVGESGTGKTTLARLLHRHCGRSRQPFARVDCATAVAAGPFGDRRTGGDDGPGELCGTLFIDDVEQLSTPLQRRLGRFLSEARRGDGHGFQLIAAMRTTPQDLAAQGVLGAELTECFAGAAVALPPLRERSGDIPAWVSLFGDGRTPRVSDAAMGYLLQYDWPGNLRELKALIERLRRCGKRDLIAAEDLPPQIRWYIPGAMLIDLTAAPAEESPFNPQAEEFQYRLIADALRRTWRR